MKTNLFKIAAMALCIAVATPGVNAQFNLKKAVSARKQAAKAFTLTDKQMAEYVKESVDWMDEHNPVPDENNAYTIRLRKLTGDLKEVDGTPLIPRRLSASSV